MKRDDFPQGIHPVDFPEANTILRAPPGMDNCSDMHYCRDYPRWVGCWRVPWRERLAILLRGRIYTSITSHQAAPPLAVVARREDIFLPTPGRSRWGWTLRVLLLVAVAGVLLYGLARVYRIERTLEASVPSTSLPTVEQVAGLLAALAGTDAPPLSAQDRQIADAAAQAQQPLDQRPGEDGQENKRGGAGTLATNAAQGVEPAPSHTDRHSPAGRLSRPWSLLSIRGGPAGRTAIWRSMNRQGLTVEPSR